MPRLIHTADTHLMPMQYSRAFRGDDFTQALKEVVRVAEMKKADAILNSGDILNSTRPTSKVMDDLKEVHELLLEIGMPMYLISGNHDRTNPHWSKILESKRNKNAGIICVDHKSFEVAGVRINALPFLSNNEFLALEKEMPEAEILMWHGAVQGFISFVDEKAVPFEDLPKDKYDLILLGDLHVHESLMLKGEKKETLVAYPGSTELVRKNEDVNKFVDLYEYKDGDWTNEAIPIPTRKVMPYSVRSPADLDQVVAEVSKAVHLSPIVLIKRSDDMKDAYARICSAVDPTKIILRVSRENKSKDKPLVKEFIDDSKKPEDFLHTFIPRDAWTFHLGQQMLQPDIDAEAALEMAVESKLLEVTE